MRGWSVLQPIKRRSAKTPPSLWRISFFKLLKSRSNELILQISTPRKEHGAFVQSLKPHFGWIFCQDWIDCTSSSEMGEISGWIQWKMEGILWGSWQLSRRGAKRKKAKNSHGILQWAFSGVSAEKFERRRFIFSVGLLGFSWDGGYFTWKEMLQARALFSWTNLGSGECNLYSFHLKRKPIKSLWNRIKNWGQCWN